MFGNRVHIKHLSVILVFAIFCCSCKDGEEQAMFITPQMDTAIERATMIFDSGKQHDAMNFLDSVYHSFGYISIQDRYNYYNFVYDKSNRLGHHSKAKQYVDSMLLLIELTDNTERLFKEYAVANFYMGDLEFEEGHYENAYKYYYKAKTIAKTNDDQCRLAYFDYRIGMVFFRNEQFASAIRSFKQSYNQALACNSANFAYFYRRQEILDNIGLCYYKLDMYDSAIAYYKTALALIDSGCNSFNDTRQRLCETAKAVVWGNMGSAYEAVGQKDTAEALMLLSIAVNSREYHAPGDAQTTRLKLAMLYLDQERYTEMNRVLSALKTNMAAAPNARITVGYNYVMWQYLEKTGRLEQAYKHLADYTKITDSLRRINNNFILRDIDEGVTNIEKQRQIEDLSKRSEFGTIYLLVAIIGFIMSAIIIAQMVSSYKKSRKNIKLLTALNEHSKEQKKKMEQVLTELQKANEEKDRILKAVSHDMRSPMNIALSLTELILSEKEHLTEEQLEYIELIRTSCNNALNLTKELLSVSTLNTELLIKEWVDLSEVVSKNVEVLRFRAAEKKQRISLQLPEKTIKLKINRDKVSRVVGNLINNAIKFSPPQSIIHIKVQPERKGATISIADNGIGIPDDLKEKVFDLFTEARRLGTGGEEPHGLGLSISKQIVDVHGGKIWFDSSVGKGTTFYVYLPDQYNTYVRTV